MQKYKEVFIMKISKYREVFESEHVRPYTIHIKIYLYC